VIVAKKRFDISTQWGPCIDGVQELIVGCNRICDGEQFPLCYCDPIALDKLITHRTCVEAADCSTCHWQSLSEITASQWGLCSTPQCQQQVTAQCVSCSTSCLPSDCSGQAPSYSQPCGQLTWVHTSNIQSPYLDTCSQTPSFQCQMLCGGVLQSVMTNADCALISQPQIDPSTLPDCEQCAIKWNWIGWSACDESTNLQDPILQCSRFVDGEPTMILPDAACQNVPKDFEPKTCGEGTIKSAAGSIKLGGYTWLFTILTIFVCLIFTGVQF